MMVAFVQVSARTTAVLQTGVMIRKGQVQGVNKGDIRGQIAVVNKLFGMVA